MKDRIKIFTACNHAGNEYEVLKLTKKYPVKFCYLENNVRRWAKRGARPEPTEIYNNDEFEWVQYYEPGKYDLAILRVDQQHTDPNIGKGQLQRDLNSVIQDIPKIVVNHGTPMWDEFYTEDLVINGGELQTVKGPKKLEGMKQMVGDNFMIVNSYTAVKRWGWGYPLIHGMDADEWYDLPKEPRPIISLSPGGLDKYYNRSLLTHIKHQVREKSGMFVNQITVDLEARDWDEYREFLGRSLIYVNPTFDSPMPRSRTEAMLSGCCVLTSKYHDADLFIEDGVNGFIVPDNPMSYAEAIHQLINYNYKESVEIGQRGRETAIKYFNAERFQKDLWFIINEIVNGRKPVWNGDTIYGINLIDKWRKQGKLERLADQGVLV